MGAELSPWACVTCSATPIDASLAMSFNPLFATGTCSNLACSTRKKVKIKLKSGVRGANYAETTGKSMFRRNP